MAIVGIAALTFDKNIFSSVDFRTSRTRLSYSNTLIKRAKFTPGFINHKGEFLNEYDALVEAKECNQIPNIYFSAKKLLSIHLI
jgi:hypothetical protein